MNERRRPRRANKPFFSPLLFRFFLEGMTVEHGEIGARRVSAQILMS
jgi:hypothetical protein